MPLAICTSAPPSPTTLIDLPSMVKEVYWPGQTRTTSPEVACSIAAAMVRASGEGPPTSIALAKENEAA